LLEDVCGGFIALANTLYLAFVFVSLRRDPGAVFFFILDRLPAVAAVRGPTADFGSGIVLSRASVRECFVKGAERPVFGRLRRTTGEATYSLLTECIKVFLAAIVYVFDAYDRFGVAPVPVRTLPFSAPGFGVSVVYSAMMGTTTFRSSPIICADRAFASGDSQLASSTSYSTIPDRCRTKSL
jgi:hypothetical protein